MCKPWKISGVSEKHTLTHGEQLQTLREFDDYEDNVDLSLETMWAPPHEDGLLLRTEKGFAGETTLILQKEEEGHPYLLSFRCNVVPDQIAPFVGKNVVLCIANDWLVTGISAPT